MRLIPLILCMLLMAGVIVANGRVRKGQVSKRLPIYRSLEVELEQEENFDDDDDDDEDDIEDYEEVPFIAASKFGRTNKPPKDAVNESRLFKHLLMFKALSGSGGGGFGGGGGGNDDVPYIIVNSPATLTNLNSNIIWNNQTSAAAAVPTTTTTTGTGTGTGTRQAMRIPYAMPMPTPVYQQRGPQRGAQPTAHIVYGPPMRSIKKAGRRSKRRKNNNNNNNNNAATNPFRMFANSLKRIQFV